MKHIEGAFRGYKDVELYYQGWLPADIPRVILLFVHGLADHSGRFANLVNYFVPRGYLLYGFDQRGHGKSPGLKGYIEDFSYFVDDLDKFVGFIRRKHSNTRIFMIAHSVGGTVATAYSLSHQADCAGLILSGPTLQPGASVPRGLMFIAPLLSRLIPRTGLYTIDASAISRDRSVIEAYQNDPLVYRGKIRTRLGIELLKTMKTLPAQFPEIRLPLLILQGTDDRLSNPQGSQLLYDRTGSIDKTLKKYAGFYHEIFNEPGREKVFQDMEEWLLRLCGRT
jgi:acylglycerol lipase